MTTAVKPKTRVPAKRKARAKTLVISFVLDETGSMEVCRDATISGFNEYVQELQKRPEKLLFTLTKFNSAKIDVVHAGVPLAEVNSLNLGSYQPAAMTPLYDAIARTIKATEQALTSERGKPNVLCVIMTDGLENASHEYTREAIFTLVKEKEGEGWTFAYLGANQDAWEVGASIGVAGQSTMSYAGTPTGTSVAMAAVTDSTTRYAARAAGKPSDSSTRNSRVRLWAKHGKM